MVYKKRGLQGVLIAAVDGLSGFPEAIAADLRNIYTAPSEEAAVEELYIFAGKWDGRYPWGAALNQFAILYGQKVPL